MQESYYEILGVEKSAGQIEIKAAYRKLAMAHHPDRNKGCKDNEAKFKKINEAYGVLSNAEKRKQYDMFGKEGQAGGFGGFGGGGFSNDFDLGDIFESFFGGGFGGGNRGARAQNTNRPKRGEDIQVILKLTLEESIFGGEKEISFDTLTECISCDGVGGSEKTICDKCDGKGQVVHRQQSVFGVIQQTVTCDECNGSGEKFKNICKDCHGKKRIKINKSQKIDIPAGIDNNMVIKIEGEGNYGLNGGGAGDLFIKFDVKLEEKTLRREEENLYYDLEIDIVEAVLGTEKEVLLPILGKRKIKIPRATQPNTVLRVDGDGVKYIDRDKKGDLFVALQIKVPKKITAKERECYENIAKEKKLNVCNKKGILDKFFG